MARFAVTVEATVTYTCYLEEEESQLVQECAKEEECSLEDATLMLYYEGRLNLYHNIVESDFSTERVIQIEEKDAE